MLANLITLYIEWDIENQEYAITIAPENKPRHTPFKVIRNTWLRDALDEAYEYMEEQYIK